MRYVILPFIEISVDLQEQLVKLHKGSLSVTSELAKADKPGGSTFTIKLPSGSTPTAQRLIFSLTIPAESHIKSSQIDLDEPVLTRAEGLFSRRGIADDTNNWAVGVESEDDSSSSGGNSGSGLSIGNQDAIILLADESVLPIAQSVTGTDQSTSNPDVRTYIKVRTFHSIMYQY